MPVVLGTRRNSPLEPNVAKMKITNVETHLLRLPVSSGAEHASGPTEWPTFDYVLVRIDTDTGPSGWGDGFGYWVPQATRAVIDHTFAPRLIGRDARDISGITQSLQREFHLSGRYGITMFAISAIDIALWDIAGKDAGLPLHRLLGGARRSEIPAYASLFRYGHPERVAERTRHASQAGFGQIKLHEVTAEAVAAARDAAGGDVPLMLDTNCPWTPAQAQNMIEQLRDYKLHWLEEPIFPPEDFASLARLQSATGMSLAAGENCCTAFQFKAMFEAGAVTYAQPSVTKVGGITEMLKVIALAEAYGISLVPHCPYFGPGLLASLHLLGTMGDDVYAEFLYYDSLEASPYGDAIVPVTGIMKVPQMPGLGMDPDPHVLADYGV